MTIFKKSYVFLLSFFTVAATIYGCKKDAWDDHNKVISQDLSKNLLQVINENPDLSKFSEYLEKTGYKDTLALAKTFTVWAPDNDALKSLDQAVVNDLSQLKRFVAYHISYQTYFTSNPKPNLSVKTLDGKNIQFTKTNFEEAGISAADKYVGNGVLHIIDQAGMPKLNAWEFMEESANTQLQKAYIESLEHTEMDTTNGVVLYTDPVTKRPVYQEGTTSPVTRNYYFQRVSDLSNEDSLSTYIILDNAAFASEQQKLKPYYTTASAEVSDSLTNWAVVKDLVISGVYTENQLAGTMTTVTGVRIHVNKSDIVEQRKLSNGIAYVVKNLSYDLMENKIPSVLIEAEYPDSLRTPSSPLLKTKRDASGLLFKDVSVSGITSSPDPLYYFRYRTTVNSVKYKVYRRALNDLYTVPISMRVNFSYRSYFPKSAEPQLQGTGYFQVAPIATLANPYEEVYIGQYDASAYGSLYVFLASAATGVTSTTQTALSLDYIKLVPFN